jgi:hypothetical protein
MTTNLSWTLIRPALTSNDSLKRVAFLNGITIELVGEAGQYHIYLNGEHVGCPSTSGLAGAKASAESAARRRLDR